MLGTTLGNYRLERELGRGGMGAVFVGTHTLLGREAAIKVLLAKYSQDQDIVQRFFNEARAATAIDHPGIVEIYDYGKDASGCAFIVMELCQGESLGARIRRKHRFTVAAALTIVRQIAGTLSAAHKAGIVHRDLKPDNVFIVPDPEVTGGERIKLLDFGIAKLATETAGPMKTSTGVIMGTPNYMSPEQCRGAGQVDSRADLYSLGCMLFELMCGRVPFVGEGSGDIIGAHLLTAPPKPSSFTPTIPHDIERLILRLLAKKPGDRPATADDVVAELALIADELPEGLETAHAIDVALEPTFTPEALVDRAAATNATSTPPPRPDPGADSTALGHAAAMAPAAAATTDRDSSTDVEDAVAHASTSVGHATAPKPADDRRTNDRRASSDDRRGHARGGSTEPAIKSINELATPPRRHTRAWAMAIGAALVIIGAVVFLATRTDEPEATVVDTSRMRVLVGTITGNDVSEAVRSRIRSLVIATLATQGKDLQIVLLPGPEDDAAGRLGRAVVLDGKVTRLAVEPNHRIRCQFAITLSRHPTRAIVARASSGATAIQEADSVNAMDTAAEECVAAMLEHLVSRRILPALGGGPPVSPEPAPVDARPEPSRPAFEVIGDPIVSSPTASPVDGPPSEPVGALDNTTLAATLRTYRIPMERCYIRRLEAPDVRDDREDHVRHPSRRTRLYVPGAGGRRGPRQLHRHADPRPSSLSEAGSHGRRHVRQRVPSTVVISLIR